MIIFLKIEVVYIMLLVVVILAIVLTVDLFVLVLVMLHLLLIGIVAPIYHLNQFDGSLCEWSTFYSDSFYPIRSDTYYLIRGGNSVSGITCGAFYVNANNAASRALWTRGAVLSFKLI